MAGRLGFVLYTLSWILGVPLLVIMFLGALTGSISPSGQLVFGVMGLLVMGLGKAVHYVLSGP